ncbi:MAG: phosphatidylserine decarboxylase family protein [Thermodesulfobacteriota bacterium]
MRIPIASEGWPFIAGALVLTLLAWLVGTWLFVSSLVLTVFVVSFFRDPERVIPADDAAIVSPADGRVIIVEKVFDDRILNDEAMKISIFMTVFNVHVNRVPASGRVVEIRYNPGKFLSANLDKASTENEQNAVVLETPSGKRLVFTQIAGLVARRIVCYAAEGGELVRGDRFGLIRFGSRLDVYLPIDCTVTVKVGDRVSAGSSTLALWT